MKDSTSPVIDSRLFRDVGVGGGIIPWMTQGCRPNLGVPSRPSVRGTSISL